MSEQAYEFDKDELEVIFHRANVFHESVNIERLSIGNGSLIVVVKIQDET